MGARPAGAYQVHFGTDGQVQRWIFEESQTFEIRLVDPPGGLHLKPGGPDLRTAIVFAAQAWQAVETAHVPVRYDEQIAQRVLQPNEVLIQFDSGTDFIGGF